MKSKTGIRYLNLGHHFWTLVIGELWYDSELEKKSALRKPDEVILPYSGHISLNVFLT